MQQLPRGAFLTVSDSKERNTMTIGWGSIGYMWQKPVIMVMVRYSRYTHHLMQQAPDFTLSLPVDGNLKSELGAAGSKSGRDGDKFDALGLTPQPGHRTASPVIAGGGLHYECRIVYRQPMKAEDLDPEICSQMYGDDDLHVLYFGEILDCYRD